VDTSFSPDQTALVTACQDGLAHLWEVESGKELPSRMKHEDVVTRVGFSPDGSMILTASNDGTICLWDGKTTLPLPRNHVLRHSAGVLSAGFLSNGHQIITGCLDGSVRTWDLAGAEMQPDLIEGVVNDDGSLSATIFGNSVRVQKVTDPNPRPIDHPVDGAVLALSLSSRGSALAALVVSPSKKNTIQIWKPIGSDLAAEIPAPINRLKTLEFSPDDSLLVATWEANGIQHVRAYDSVSGAEWSFPHSEDVDSAIAFDPRGKAVAFGNGSRVAVYEGFSSAPRNGQFVVEGNVRHLAFSADGKRILVCQNDSAINPKSALILDSETGQRIGPQYWHRDGVLDGAFSPDGSRIVTGGEDRELILWNVGSPAESLAPMNHHHQVRGVAFSGDGRWIGSVAADRTARLWDSETGFPITPPLNCESNQTQIILLPDQRRFVTMQTPVRSWIWTLPSIDLSPEDAVALGHLLNADIRTSGPMNNAQSSSAWHNLTQKFPSLFRTTQQQIRYWHERQLRYAEANSQPLAIAFHRRYIESLRQMEEDDVQNLAGSSSSSGH
jgi:WD40 repeat protein